MAKLMRLGFERDSRTLLADAMDATGVGFDDTTLSKLDGINRKIELQDFSCSVGRIRN